MRPSSAVLTDTAVRLWDLVFPSERPLLARTRAAYVHIDNLVAYSKRDRDAKVHAFLACYRPDETVLLFFLAGELVNAAVMAPIGRFPVAIGEALKHVRAEPERAEIAFHTVPSAQLAAMFASCAQPPQDLGLDPTSPMTVFDNVLAKRWSGTLELISNGRVNYLTVKDGHYMSGLFSDQRPAEEPRACLARMFGGRKGEPAPKVSVRAFAGLEALPAQAAPALVQVFRQFVWDIVDLAERELPGDAARRAERLRMKLIGDHDALQSVGGTRGAQVADPIIGPEAFCDGVAAWTKEFLGELEIIHPQIAPRLLREVAREQRFQLAALGFFDKLPWHVVW